MERGYPTAGLPNAHLFYDPKTKRVLISHLTTQRNTGFTVPFGKFVRTDADEMRQDGLRIISRALALHDADPGTESSELDDQSPSFYRRHRFIAVAYKPDEKALIIQSMDRARGGHVGPPEKSIKVPVPATSAELWRILEECFGRSLS